MDMKNHWSQYLNAIGNRPTPTSSNSFPTSSSEKGVSGFQDLTPKNSEIQARYDAMSLKWEGVSASNLAVMKDETFKAYNVQFKQ